MDLSKGFSPIIVIAIVLVALVIGVGGFLFLKQEPSGTSSSPLETVKDVLGIEPSTKDWKVYTNIAIGFSIKYPPHYIVKEQAQSGPNGPTVSVSFLPGPEDQLDSWKEPPLSVLAFPAEQFEEIESQIETWKKEAEYLKEGSKTVGGISGLEIKVGMNDGGATKHVLYVLVPYNNGHLMFNTFAQDRGKLESEVSVLFDAFLSTFQSGKNIETERQKEEGFVYPADYVPVASEVPAGFRLATQAEAVEAGISGNPAFIYDREIYQYLYDNIDTAKVDRLYAAVYVHEGDPHRELGVFAAQYKTEEELDSEIPKMRATKEPRIFLRSGRILIIAWSDDSADTGKVLQTTQLLQARLNLRGI